LGLLPGHLTPSLQESLVRLGTWLPFAPAAHMLGHFTHATVSEATARRLTEDLGAAYVQLQLAEVDRLERELPDAPQGPAVQQVSVDGAQVPLVGGLWGEVKTAAIGTVTAAADGTVQTTALSYFSRRAEAAEFAHQALVEVHRRGTATAGIVVGVADGAEWCQGFLDLHRPDAVRILDFSHALGYLIAAAEARWGAGTSAGQAWLADQERELVQGDPAVVLAALAAFLTAEAPQPAVAAEAQATALRYLTDRLDQIQYKTFLAAGYPIGSGAVESANKLVVEARLKGAGMHWAPDHVNPMVALRTVACSDRWAAVWPRLTAQVRQAARAATATRRAVARSSAPPPSLPAPSAPPILDQPPTPLVPALVAAATQPERPKLVVNGRPTEDHPWRQFRYGSNQPQLRALPKP
jgi:hypothetical protein